VFAALRAGEKAWIGGLCPPYEKLWGFAGRGNESPLLAQSGIQFVIQIFAALRAGEKRFWIPGQARNDEVLGGAGRGVWRRPAGL
jgi:hypothetical protein